jgi:catechol 2,3-dioxygenase-like lactoylglutathione lyase family enzyme
VSRLVTADLAPAAREDRDELPSRVHHHAWVVEDQARTRHFYEDVLGLPLVATWCEVEELRSHRPGSLEHIALQVDLPTQDAMAARLAAAGIAHRVVDHGPSMRPTSRRSTSTVAPTPPASWRGGSGETADRTTTCAGSADGRRESLISRRCRTGG